MTDYPTLRKAKSIFRGELMLLVVFSLLFAVPAQAETTAELTHTERVVRACLAMPKQQEIKREEYGTLSEDEREDRLKALYWEADSQERSRKITEKMLWEWAEEKDYYTKVLQDVPPEQRSDALKNKIRALDERESWFQAKEKFYAEEREKNLAEICFLEGIVDWGKGLKD